MPEVAFEALVVRYGPDVMRYLVVRLGRPDAEDAFQDTMLAALRSYESLRDPGAARAWLLRIAERVVIDTARARSRRPTPIESPEVIASSGDPPDPAGVWERARRLPDKQRAAVALRFALDLPYREIGRIMKTSEAAARRNVHEGLATLRSDLTSRPR